MLREVSLDTELITHSEVRRLEENEVAKQDPMPTSLGRSQALVDSCREENKEICRSTEPWPRKKWKMLLCVKEQQQFCKLLNVG